MFTGIVEAAVEVLAFERDGEGASLLLPPPPGVADWEVQVGQSIAVAGACLTLAGIHQGGLMRFDLSSETLERTWFSGLRQGRLVNLERAMRLGDRLDGHLVSGHVDGQGRIEALEDVGDGGLEVTFQVDAALDRYLIEKGSVTLDGTSLTLVEPSAGRFRVAMIPLTLELTAFGRAQVGQAVNVEVDMIGKWIERLMP
ncbi:MAG: riboflavin synthase [Planctomycetota bacterium]|nr:riboflavin synthase [Planctomycetota bacterium]